MNWHLHRTHGTNLRPLFPRQTLLAFRIRFNSSLSRALSLFVLGFCSLNFLLLPILRGGSDAFGIFRVALLFICQGSKRSAFAQLLSYTLHNSINFATQTVRPTHGCVERRRRDLNPRAAINDLHPFQGCPFNLLGTSPG